MGIVNVTPDSFSDGGLHATTAAAIAHAEKLVSQGAHMLDIGGESSRPGAEGVGVEEELARVLPVIRGLRDCPVPVAVDTVKAEVINKPTSDGTGSFAEVKRLLKA